MDIRPANGGVLAQLTSEPTNSAIDYTAAPRTAYVIRVGGGVRWLKPGECVVIDPSKAHYYAGPIARRDNDVACEADRREGDFVVIDQRHVLAVNPHSDRSWDCTAPATEEGKCDGALRCVACAGWGYSGYSD